MGRKDNNHDLLMKIIFDIKFLFKLLAWCSNSRMIGSWHLCLLPSFASIRLLILQPPRLQNNDLNNKELWNNFPQFLKRAAVINKWKSYQNVIVIAEKCDNYVFKLNYVKSILTFDMETSKFWKSPEVSPRISSSSVLSYTEEWRCR